MSQRPLGGLNQEELAREKYLSKAPQIPIVENLESSSSEHSLDTPGGNNEYVAKQGPNEDEAMGGAQDDVEGEEPVVGAAQVHDCLLEEIPQNEVMTSKPLPSESTSQRSLRKTPTPWGQTNTSHQKRPPSELRQIPSQTRE